MWAALNIGNRIFQDQDLILKKKRKKKKKFSRPVNDWELDSLLSFMSLVSVPYAYWLLAESKQSKVVS